MTDEGTELDHIRASIETMPANELRKQLEFFKLLTPRIPDFEAILNEFCQAPETLLCFCNWMTKWAFNARSDDSGSLKWKIESYLPKDAEVEAIVPPLGPTKETKSYSKSASRGFNHKACALALCPPNLFWHFESSVALEGFMGNVKCGNIPITSKDLPSFLYDEDIPYDEENPDIGALRGYLLVRVYRHIFCGPSNGLSLSKKGGRCKIKMHKMKEVTPRTIAYTAVQIYFTLSSADEWTQVIGKFDLLELFETIVALFEDNEGCGWAAETLQWWNDQIGFKDASSGSNSESETELGDESNVREIVKRAHQKRRAQQQASAALAANQPNPSLPPTPPTSQPTNPPGDEANQSQPAENNSTMNNNLGEDADPGIDNASSTHDSTSPSPPLDISQLIQGPLATQFMQWIAQQGNSSTGRPTPNPSTTVGSQSTSSSNSLDAVPPALPRPRPVAASRRATRDTLRDVSPLSEVPDSEGEVSTRTRNLKRTSENNRVGKGKRRRKN